MSIFFRENTDGFPFINGFSFSFSSDSPDKCTIVSLRAKTDNGVVPGVQFKITDENDNEIYISPEYRAVSADGKEKQWRLPPLMFTSARYKAVFSFSQYTAFEILSFDAVPETKNPGTDGVLFDAHLGFFAAAPQNTLPAFELAGKCGFNGCITVPKITKDGIFVCIHDDTINNTARTADGKKLTEDIYVKDLTYDELLKYDFGVYKNPLFRGTKLPLLNDYFSVCKKYGMAPIFSIHPDFTDVQWLEVKNMLKAYGLLPSFKIKSNSFKIIEHTFGIFGNEIGGYIFWKHNFEDEYTEKMSDIGIDTSECKAIIEIQNKLDDDNLSKDVIEKIKSKGFDVSCLACWQLKTGDYYKRMISLGVREFNDDYHCSFGLNW